ncbi:protein of unknown function [Nitratireductor aquimarinus]
MCRGFESLLRYHFDYASNINQLQGTEVPETVRHLAQMYAEMPWLALPTFLAVKDAITFRFG